MLTILAIAFLISIGGSIVFYSLRYGISPMPSSKKAAQAVLKIIPHNIQGTIVELGSGWGNLAFPLAQRFPECHVKAYEISLIPWLVSLGIQKWKKYPNLQIIRADFFQKPLADTSLVVCYLYPGAMWKLKEKFTQELKPDTLIVTHTFAIPGWAPIKVVELDDLYRTPVYLYRY